MSGLDLDSPLLNVKNLSGVHLDAVRCIYDERLNRLKPLQARPLEQLNAFGPVVDDAFSFWTQVSDLPEDRSGRRTELAEKLSGFFDRVIRYAEFHDPKDLTEEEQALQKNIVNKTQTRKTALETS